MDVVKQTELAHALYRSHGDRAEAEAAQRGRVSMEAGKTQDAETWRAIRARIRQLRGANQS